MAWDLFFKFYRWNISGRKHYFSIQNNTNCVKDSKHPLRPRVLHHRICAPVWRGEGVAVVEGGGVGELLLLWVHGFGSVNCILT